MDCSTNQHEGKEENVGISNGNLENIESIRVNRIGLVFVCSVALALGFAPATLVIGRPEILMVAAIVFSVIVVYKIRSFNTIATEKPSSLEFVLGGLGAMYSGVAVALGWLFLYGILLLGLWILNLPLFGFTLDLNAGLIAPYVSLLIMMLYVYVLIPEAVDNLAQQLYPQAAGVKSAFYDRIVSNRKAEVSKIIFIILGGVIVITVNAVIMKTLTAWWVYLILLMYLFYASISYSKTSFLPRYFSNLEKKSALAISKLLEAIGYQVVLSPRTGRREIDPLLLSLDLFAQKDTEGYAIQVFTSSSRFVNSIELVYSLENASFALEKFQSFEGESIKVKPIIVFIGDSADKNFSDEIFAKVPATKQPFLVWIKDVKAVDKIFETETAEERREMAMQYLGIFEKSNHFGDNASKMESKGGEN